MSTFSKVIVGKVDGSKFTRFESGLGREVKRRTFATMQEALDFIDTLRKENRPLVDGGGVYLDTLRTRKIMGVQGITRQPPFAA